MNRKRLLSDLSPILLILLLLLVFFWPVTLGGKTLVPMDNLFTTEPWATFAAELGVGRPHNELLSDLVLQNYVWKSLVKEALQSRQLPLWNPYILSGQPFLAAGQHSALYPLSVVYYVLPLLQAYGFFTVLQLLVAGIAIYIYGRTIGLRRIGALVSAIVYPFSGFMVVSIVHPMIIATAAWLPLLLAAVERLVRIREETGPQTQTRLPLYVRWMLLGAVALATLLLAGHVEISYYVILVTGLYAIVRLTGLLVRSRRMRDIVYPGGAIAGLLVIGIALAAVQLVPLYELVTQNFRQDSASYSQVVGWAYPLRRLIAFVVPDFFGNPSHHSYIDVFSRQVVEDLWNARGQPITSIYWDVKNYVEGGSYVGVLPLVLALIAVWRARSRYVWFFLALGVLSILFVFGTPLYALLYYGLPGIRQLHSPFRWVFPYTVSVSVLAGCGASWLADQQHKFKTPWVRRFGGVLCLSAVLGLAALAVSSLLPDIVIPLADRMMQSLALATEAFADGRAFFSYQFRNLAILLLAIAGSGLTVWLVPVRRRLAGVPWWQLVGLLVIVAELFVIGMGFNPAADPQLAAWEPPVVSFLQQDTDPWRFTTLNLPQEKTFNANAGMLYGLSDVRGYDSIIPRQYVEYMQLLEPQGELLYNRIAPLTREDSLDSPLMDLLNIRYVLTTAQINNPGYSLVYDGELRVYRNEDCLPRAFVCYQATVLPDAVERNAALRTSDPRDAVILEEHPEFTESDAVASGWHAAQVVRYDLNEVIVEAHLTSPGYLVLTDNYFVGWKAYQTTPNASEQEIPIYRAYGTFRAVALDSGQQTVRFKYTPFSAKVGLFVSFVAGIVLVLLVGYLTWQRFVFDPSGGDSSVKRVAKNALTPMALSLVNRLIDMAFAMLTLRILAPGGAGRLGFATNFIAYFETAVLFGLGAYLTREIAKERDQAGLYVSNSVVLRLVLWLASLPVLLLSLFAYVRLAGLGLDSVVAVGFFFLALIPELFADSITSVFYAHERMEFPAAITSVTTLVRVTLGAMVLLLGYGFVGLAATSLLVNLTTAVTLGILAVRLFGPLTVELDSGLRRRMVVSAFPLMVNNLLSRVFFQADVLFLMPLRGDVEVGYYQAAYRYIRALDIIPSYFTMAVFPLISRYADSERDSLVRAYVLSAKMLVMVALPIAAGTTFIARELILILAGASYLPSSMYALQILVWYMPVGFVNSVTHYVLIALNQQHFLTRAFFIGAAFNVSANLLFIPRYGYLAAAVITVLSEFALLFPFYYCVRKNLTALPWLDIFGRPSVAAAVMMLVLWLMREQSLVFRLPAAAVAYLSALALLGTFRQPDVALVLNLIPARIKKYLPALVTGE